MSAPRFLDICFLVCLLILVAGAPARAQTATCVITGSTDNQNRKALAPILEPGVGWHHIAVECSAPHTRPFGIWGVSSNVGGIYGKDQFRGWGAPWAEPGQGREWNSCTRDWPPNALYDCPTWAHPPCEFYNYNLDPSTGFYTQQITIHGINTHGVFGTSYPVSCPRYYSDGSWHGGCEEIVGATVTLNQNFMVLWELDWPDSIDRIQKLLFPDRSATLTTCDAWGCALTASPWADPTGYDFPVWPPLVYAQMAIAIRAELFTSAPYGDCDQYACGICDPGGWCPPCVPLCFIPPC